MNSGFCLRISRALTQTLSSSSVLPEHEVTSYLEGSVHTREVQPSGYTIAEEELEGGHLKVVIKIQIKVLARVSQVEVSMLGLGQGLGISIGLWLGLGLGQDYLGRDRAGEFNLVLNAVNRI
eukprot:1326334-Amorphochlora_amoeboformis.AAC.1